MSIIKTSGEASFALEKVFVWYPKSMSR